MFFLLKNAGMNMRRLHKTILLYRVSEVYPLLWYTISVS